MALGESCDSGTLQVLRQEALAEALRTLVAKLNQIQPHNPLHLLQRTHLALSVPSGELHDVLAQMLLAHLVEGARRVRV